MNKIILIGGVPGTGKTTLSRKIALEYNIENIIHLDVFKSIIKQYIQNEKYFNTTTHDAYKIENISCIEGYKKHCECIYKYLIDYIKILKDEIIIIEGAQLTPLIIDLLYPIDVLYINLNEEKEELFKRYEKKRRKSNWKEDIECIIEIQNYLSKFDVIQIGINSFDNKIIKEFLEE